MILWVCISKLLAERSVRDKEMAIYLERVFHNFECLSDIKSKKKTKRDFMVVLYVIEYTYTICKERGRK